MMVIDASAYLEWLLRTDAGTAVADLLREDDTLHGPHLVDLEVAQVLRRFVGTGELTEEEGRVALDDFVALPIARYGHAELLPRVWELRHNLTAYDAAYVALAELLDAQLVTCDERLASAPGISARVTVVA